MDFIQILNKISQPNKKSKKFAHFNVTKIITKKIKAETETEEFHDRVYYFSCFSLQKTGQRQFVRFKYVSFAQIKVLWGQYKCIYFIIVFLFVYIDFF